MSGSALHPLLDPGAVFPPRIFTRKSSVNNRLVQTAAIMSGIKTRPKTRHFGCDVRPFKSNCAGKYSSKKCRQEA